MVAGVVSVTSDDGFGSIVSGYGNLGLQSITIYIFVNDKKIDPKSVWEYIPLSRSQENGNFWIKAIMK